MGEIPSELMEQGGRVWWGGEDWREGGWEGEGEGDKGRGREREEMGWVWVGLVAPLFLFVGTGCGFGGYPGRALGGST